MTEAEWVAATDPKLLLYGPVQWRPDLEQPVDLNPCHPRLDDERKLRLYACECFHRSFPQLVYAADRLAFDAAERFADGLIQAAELTTASRPCGGTALVLTYQPAIRAARSVVGGGAIRIDHPAGTQVPLPGSTQCDLLRCIFGNPFRPVAFDPRWRSETAVALAAGIYDGRHFDRLPILADALEDAGCDAVELLNHLRGPGPHARGCWAVDAVLGRE